MSFSLLSWLILTFALVLCAVGHRHGHVHEHHPHAARAAPNICTPAVVTETVYVTATCPPGQCPPPTSEFSSSVVSSVPASSKINTPPAPPPSSSAAYHAPAPPQSAPPTNEVTFSSVGKPQSTANPSLLCPHVEAQAQAAGSPIPPMPFGAHLDASLATYDALPTLAAALCQAPENFHKITAIPNHGSIKNSCNYEVYVDSLGCGDGAQHEPIPAGQTWSEPLRSCPKEQGTLVYKVAKADNPSKPIQFEVGLAPEPAQPGQENTIWYDISFLDCMRPNTTDLSACPGWEGGVQCIPGKQGCQVFVCGPSEYCDGSTYTVPEFGQTQENKNERIPAGAPVSACNTRQEGIAFELCAAN